MAARSLMRTGLSSLVRMNWHGYSLRFHPSNLSSLIWIDREARWEDGAFLRAWARPGDVIVDVGANIGTTVLPTASAVGATGRILAVEAHPRLVSYLVSNLADNHMTNVDVMWCALGEIDGSLSFMDDSSDDRNGVATDGTLVVPMRTLDGITSAFPRVALLKIDVEGYELPVLRAGRSTLSRTDCIVLESFESHTQRFGYATTDLTGFLVQEGFEIFRAEPSHRLVPLGPDHHSRKCEDLVALRAGVDVRAPFHVGSDESG